MKGKRFREVLPLNLIDEARRYAEQMHQGQVRKLSGKPYFSHVENVATILMKAGAGKELIAAGYLHDTVEDTQTSPLELEELFGTKVADLVSSNTEDKRLSWEERKLHTIQAIQSLSLEERCLLAADKLDNVKSLHEAWKKSGEEIWSHFKRGRDQQGWYYQSVSEQLFKNLETKDIPTYFFSLKRCIDDLFPLSKTV
ncbi:HD domain-containing protein [Metabacillus sp. GX 13764]|uniref:HD domain-containing protein n=1 Tax=Metabacillus kandeliae TaxID=2900151 RepID=UPI001E5A46B8|nr:HD domain-containing protein [Metabacillus kandeliae]MCD7035456.1 HD domain-containing protein [Metabacillus kandeliae]